MTRVAMSKKRKKSSKTPEQIRSEVKHKNNMFSRYMLFRYSLALFFFANVYWLLALLFQMSFYMVIPIALILILVSAIAEQFKLYGAKEPKLNKTVLALKLQLLAQLLVVGVVLLNQTTVAFPTLANHTSTKVFMFALQTLGILLVLLNLRRIEQIKKNQDKHYQRFQIIEKYF